MSGPPFDDGDSDPFGFDDAHRRAATSDSGGGSGVEDTAFGGRRRRRRQRGHATATGGIDARWAIVVGVAMIVVVVFVFGGRRRPASRAVPVPTTAATSIASGTASPGGDRAGTDKATVPGAPSAQATVPISPTAVAAFHLDCPTTFPVDGGTGPPSIPPHCSSYECTRAPDTPDDRGSMTCVEIAATPDTAETTSGQPGGLGRLFANTHGLGLFAINDDGNNSVKRIDLDTGLVDASPPNFRGSGSFLAVSGSGGAATGLTLGDVEGLVIAPCSDGTYWSLGVDNTTTIRPDYANAVLRHVRAHPGSAAEVIEQIDISALVSIASLDGVIGTTSDDRPIVSGPNGQGYIVASDGGFQRLTTGKLVAAQHDAYSEIVCNASAQCSLVLHSKAFPTVSFLDETTLRATFSPDGLHALLAPSVDRSAVTGAVPATVSLGVRMVDMATGAVTVVDSARAPANFLTPPTGPTSPVWTPDGSTVMLIDGGHLERIDVATDIVTSYVLPPPLDSGWQLLAIA